jgi:hypothetical protein
MKYIAIVLVCYSAILCSCKSTTEPVTTPPTAYQRAVGPLYPSFAGKDSVMDACLSLVRTYSMEWPDSTFWTATAAFNIGVYPQVIGLATVGDRPLPFIPPSDYYMQEFPTVDSTVWNITDYNTMNFSEPVTMPATMKCTNHSLWDTVSKSNGFTIQYSGFEGRTLTASGFFSHHTAPYTDSLGFLNVIAVSDAGTVTITPEMLKSVPVGGDVAIQLYHDRFYTKMISQNTISHKVGFYTQTESDLFFRIGK